jgi:DNA repair protein RecO (recombination protein O)
VRLHTTEALLLDVRDLHDRDRIVVFLTRDEGKKRGVARGARLRHSRYAGLLQPLAKVQVTWFEKSGQELVRISTVDLLRPAHRLHEDLDGLLLGTYLADHVLEFAQENEPSELLFRLLDATLVALGEGVDRDLAARYFEAWVLRLAGIFPAPQSCPLCGNPLGESAAVHPDGETLVCGNCGPAGARRVGGDVLGFLRRIGQQRLGEMAVPGAATLRQVEELCGRVRRHFLQRELRSYEVIQRTLAALP